MQRKQADKKRRERVEAEAGGGRQVKRARRDQGQGRREQEEGQRQAEDDDAEYYRQEVRWRRC